MTKRSQIPPWIYPIFFLATFLLGEFVSSLAAIAFTILGILVFSKYEGDKTKVLVSSAPQMILRYGAFFIILLVFAFQENIRSCEALAQLVPYAVIILINNVILFSAYEKWKGSGFRSNFEIFFYAVQILSIGYVIINFIWHYDFFIYYLVRVPACLGL